MQDKEAIIGKFVIAFYCLIAVAIIIFIGKETVFAFVIWFTFGIIVYGIYEFGSAIIDLGALAFHKIKKTPD